VIALARVQRTVIVVDDVDGIDEPSAALLAALAYKTERNPLMLVLACDHELGDAASGSLRLLRKVAHSVVLPQLQLALPLSILLGISAAIMVPTSLVPNGVPVRGFVAVCW